jgi:predicted nucleic acid-binding protein
LTGVFLDTVGLIAVWDTTDQWHIPAAGAYRRLLGAGRSILTTSYVLLECGNASARKPYRFRVNAFREALISEGLLIEPLPEDIEDAWRAYDLGGAAQAGIVDHVSFAVMRRLGLTEAFTNDRHFVAAGFQVLF